MSIPVDMGSLFLHNYYIQSTHMMLCGKIVAMFLGIYILSLLL